MDSCVASVALMSGTSLGPRLQLVTIRLVTLVNAVPELIAAFCSAACS